MTTEIKPGDKIRDNDPRESGRVLTVEHIADGYAHCYRSPQSTYRTRIRLDRIYTDDKPRRSGFSLTGKEKPQ